VRVRRVFQRKERGQRLKKGMVAKQVRKRKEKTGDRAGKDERETRRQTGNYARIK